MFHCSRCPYTTSVKCNLVRHEQTPHLQRESYACGVCGFTTKDKSHHRRHMESARHQREAESADHIEKLKSDAVEAPIEWKESIYKSLYLHLCNYRTAFMNMDTEVVHRLKNGRWGTMSLKQYEAELTSERPDLPLKHSGDRNLQSSLIGIFDEWYSMRPL